MMEIIIMLVILLGVGFIFWLMFCSGISKSCKWLIAINILLLFSFSLFAVGQSLRFESTRHNLMTNFRYLERVLEKQEEPVILDGLNQFLEYDKIYGNLEIFIERTFLEKERESVNERSDLSTTIE